MMKRNLLIGVVVILVACFCAAVAYLRDARERARDMSCKSRLASFGSALLMCALDSGGEFPSNIVDTTPYCNNAKLFICPGSTTPTPASLDLRNATGWFDYVYIHWPEGTNTAHDGPILYDRRLSHHRGKGINILRLSDLAKPKCDRILWDEGAQWLLKFAKEHPELDIQIPEDLENGD